MTETIRIEGMTCGGCASSVQKALERLPISSVQVEIGQARVEYDENVVRHEQLIEAIEDAGFDIPAQQS